MKPQPEYLISGRTEVLGILYEEGQRERKSCHNLFSGRGHRDGERESPFFSVKQLVVKGERKCLVYLPNCLSSITHKNNTHQRVEL